MVDENSCQITGLGLNNLGKPLITLTSQDHNIVKNFVDKVNAAIEDYQKKIAERKKAIEKNSLARNDEEVGVEERLLARKLQARKLKNTYVEAITQSKGTVAERKEKKNNIINSNAIITRNRNERKC